MVAVKEISLAVILTRFLKEDYRRNMLETNRCQRFQSMFAGKFLWLVFSEHKMQRLVTE